MAHPQAAHSFQAGLHQAPGGKTADMQMQCVPPALPLPLTWQAVDAVPHSCPPAALTQPLADCERLLAKAATVLAGVVDKVATAEEAEEEAAQAPAQQQQQQQGWGGGSRWATPPAAQAGQWGAPARQQAVPAEQQQQGAADQVAHLASVLDLSQVRWCVPVPDFSLLLCLTCAAPLTGKCHVRPLRQSALAGWPTGQFGVVKARLPLLPPPAGGLPAGGAAV